MTAEAPRSPSKRTAAPARLETPDDTWKMPDGTVIERHGDWCYLQNLMTGSVGWCRWTDLQPLHLERLGALTWNDVLRTLRPLPGRP